jgi:hypothetical protein
MTPSIQEPSSLSKTHLSPSAKMAFFNFSRRLRASRNQQPCPSTINYHECHPWSCGGRPPVNQILTPIHTSSRDSNPRIMDPASSQKTIIDSPEINSHPTRPQNPSSCRRSDRGTLPTTTRSHQPGSLLPLPRRPRSQNRFFNSSVPLLRSRTLLHYGQTPLIPLS